MAEPKKRHQDPRTPLEAEAPPRPLPRRTAPTLESAPPWIAASRHRGHLDTMWLLVCGVLTACGWMFFGWRVIWALIVVCAMALLGFEIARRVIRQVRPKRAIESYAHVIALAMLTGLSLPLLREPAVLIVAGVAVGLLAHFVGRTHRLRAHPVAVVLVLVWILPMLIEWRHPDLQAKVINQPINAVLRPNRLFFGDVMEHPDEVGLGRWAAVSGDQWTDAVLRHEPYSLLVHDQVKMLEPPSILVNMLTSGELIGMKELLVGSVPGPIGGSSRALLILIGLYLIYRRLAWWPVALAAFVAALGALLIMPVRDGEQLTIVFSRLMQLDPPIATAYVGYMLLGSPLVLLVMVLAPMSAPMSDLGRVLYGALIGALMIIGQWLFQSPMAAPLGLLVASALSRPLDSLQRSPFAIGIAAATPAAK